MGLLPIPPGLVRLAYLSGGGKWQADLLAEVRKFGFGKILKAKSLIASYEMFLDPTRMEHQNTGVRTAGKTLYSTLVLPRIQGLYFQFPPKFLIVNPSPNDRKIRCTYPGGVSDIPIFEQGPKDEDSQSESKDKSKVIGPLFGIENPLPNGIFTLFIPSERIARPEIDNSDSSYAKIDMTFSFHVEWAALNPFLEEQHVLVSPVTLESVLIETYPESFAHLVKQKRKSDSDNRRQKSGETGPLNAIARMGDLLTDAHKQVSGMVKEEWDESTQARVSNALAAAKLYFNEDPKRKAAISSALSVWDSYFGAKDVIEKWEKLWTQFSDAADQAPHLKKIRQAIDSGFLNKTFHATRWQKYYLDLLKKNNGKKNHFIDLVQSDGPEEELRAFLRSSVPRELDELDNILRLSKKGAQRAATALWAVDTAINTYRFAQMIQVTGSKTESAEVERRRLAQAVETYAERYSKAPNPMSVTRLSTLAKRADLAASERDEAAKDAVLASTELILGLGTLITAGPGVMAVVKLGKETLSTAADIFGAASDAVDQRLFGAALGEWKDSASRSFSLAADHDRCWQDLMSRSGPGSSRDPMVQFQLRRMAVIGLLRLIERCGSRFADKAKFKEKVEQNELEGYIRYFLLPRKNGFVLPIIEVSGPHMHQVSFPPLDLVWGYIKGHKDKGKKWNTRFNSDEDSRWFEGKFQSLFPIHKMESKDALSLATTFSRHFGGVLSQSLVHSRVQAQTGEGDWLDVEGFTHHRSISPFTPLRIVVIFRSSESLVGMPLSIQLVRTDTLPDTEGVLYKVPLEPVYQSERDRGLDGGLVSIGPEKSYLKPDAGFYSAVLHPFYFDAKSERIFQGAKPCGWFTLWKKNFMQVKFDLVVGKTRKAIPIGQSGKSTFKVDVDPWNSVLFQMVLDRAFLAHKTSDPTKRPIFDRAGTAEFCPKLVGCFLKSAGKRVFYPPGRDGTIHPADFDFAWDSEFEVIFILASRRVDEAYLKEESIRFDADLTSRHVGDAEEGGVVEGLMEIYRKQARSDMGPVHPLVFQAIAGFPEPVKNLTPEGLVNSLLEKDIVTKDETVRVPKAFPPTVPYHYFAAGLNFGYSVQGHSGDMTAMAGLKPFARSFGQPKKQRYAFGITTQPPEGLQLEQVLVLDLPPIPKGFLKGTQLAGKEEVFVTKPTVHPLLRIEKVDL